MIRPLSSTYCPPHFLICTPQRPRQWDSDRDPMSSYSSLLHQGRVHAYNSTASKILASSFISMRPMHWHNMGVLLQLDRVSTSHWYLKQHAHPCILVRIIVDADTSTPHPLPQGRKEIPDNTGRPNPYIAQDNELALQGTHDKQNEPNPCMLN